MSRVGKRWGLGFGAVSAILVVAVLASDSAALGPATGTVFAAPYAGFGLTSTSVTTNGCASFTKIVVKPHFSPSTGIGHATSHASATACGSPHSFPVSELNLTFGLYGGNFTVNTTGIHRMIVKWSLTYLSNLSALPANTSQFALAESIVTVGAHVTDVTAGGSTVGVASWSNVTQVSHGYRNISAKNTVVTLSFHGRLTARHVYFFTTFVSVEVFTLVNPPGLVTASGTVNMGSAGEQGRLIVMKVL